MGPSLSLDEPGEDQPEETPLPGLALDVHPAAVGIHDVADDPQAEADT